ncbi:MBL fold metallo-hydrolase [Gemmatimonadota bacterium]
MAPYLASLGPLFSELMTALLPSAPETTPLELVRHIEAGRTVQIMDVRAPERVATGRVDLVPSESYYNIRGSVLITHSDLAPSGLDSELPVVTVCGQGKDSAVIAAHLNKLGANASSLAGGMVGWMNLAVPRELDPPQGLDRLIQFDRIGKGCLGYLLVSEGQALIVDPPLHFGPYRESLRDAGAELVGVADTHVHADYVSGAVPMAREFGVPYHLHPADAVYPYDGTPGRIQFQPLSHGDVLELGETSVRVMHTPGHTEGSVTYLVNGRVALTGDFLFVESIGRPDLGGMEEIWAGQLWDSVERAKGGWDPGMAIYPAHYATARERRMGRAVGIPFGDLLEENPVLKISERDAFLRFILENKASFPDAYRTIKALNVGLAPIVQDEVEVLEVGRNECALGGPL